MKEFEAKDFAEGLRTGLRAFEGNPINKQSLLKAFNVLTSPAGLIPFEAVTSIATSGWVYSGKEVLLYLNELGMLYEVDIDSYAHNLVYTFPAGVASRLEVFDAGQFLLITGGHNEYCSKNYLGTYVEASPNEDNVYEYSGPTLVFPSFKTICNFRGQAVCGNIIPGNPMTGTDDTYTWGDCGSNSVVWGKIGQFDLRPDQSNVAGYRRMDWRGQVYKVMELGNSIMVYGSGGITSLNPTNAVGATFGTREIGSIGIINFDSVAGNKHLHVYITRENEVWKIGKDMVPKNLGYKEWIEDLDSSELRITHDAERNRFYISDTSRCFVLTATGLTECYQNVRSVAGVEGTALGAITADASPDLSVDIMSDTLDYGQRSLKHIEFLEYGYRGGGTLEGYLQYRKAVADTWNVFEDSPCEEAGICRIGITSTEFQIGLKASSYLDFYLTAIKQRVKFVDNRSIRGLYRAN